MTIKMNENLKLAWRNLWRNRRRTLITVASVFFAIFFALVMRSLQLGSYNHMFKNIIESYTGYIQVQQKDFWDDKCIDNLIEYSDTVNQVILSDNNVDATIPRLESFALASNGPQTKGVLVLGIDPIKENLLSKVEDKLVKFRLTDEAIEGLKKENLPEKVEENIETFRNDSYSSVARLQYDLDISDDELPGVLPYFQKHASFKSQYFEMGKNDALVGDKLAKYLLMNVGDTIILISQGYHGVSAAGKYRISGIVKMPSPEIDGRVVYLPIDVCQKLYGAPNMLTSLALHVKSTDDNDISKSIENLQPKLDKQFAVVGWRTMNELLIQQMDADSKSGMIMIYILYMVIAFGVFGTVLMMTAERRREFGVLVSIGMQKTKLALVVAIEMILIGLMGIISGVIVSVPAILIGYYNPIRFSGQMAKMYEDMGFEAIMPFMWFGNYYYVQSLVVFFIVLVAIAYPVIKIAKLEVIQALRA